MPLHFGSPLLNSVRASTRPSRRQFLAHAVGAVGVGASLLGAGSVTHAVYHAPITPTPAPGNRDVWAVLSDTHAPADESVSHFGVNLCKRIRGTVCGVLAMPPGLSGVIVNGDCALHKGECDDYVTFRDLLVRPIVAAGLPVHVTMGNHDRRDHFRTTLEEDLSLTPPVGGRNVGVIQGRYANMFLLDSLEVTDHSSGRIGSEQLNWLSSTLGTMNDRPALVFGHHPLDRDGNFLGIGGWLKDGSELFDVMAAHRHVKAYLYGHTHRWNIERRGRIHLVNLPATAYVFEPGQPPGWVEMGLWEGGAEFRVHRIPGTEDHSAFHEVPVIRWS